MPKLTANTALLTAGLIAGAACAREDFAAERAALVAELREASAQAEQFGAPPLSDRVLEVIAATPRHEFVPEGMRRQAYANRPLPIGEDQTISQPYIVALMTDLAAVDGESNVLEVGTGSGYQAAVLAALSGRVHSIEIIEPLGVRARKTLERLGYDNVSVTIGDGYAGLPEFAPYDAIVVTAAPETVPEPLIEQLAVGGRLVIPVGEQGRGQILQVLTMEEDGARVQNVIAVRFVPLTRGR
ncbi:MAG: protein-L-isoaspartate(D-aspartate) O-methyltransferase [Pseudomonadota bacterium]